MDEWMGRMDGTEYALLPCTVRMWVYSYLIEALALALVLALAITIGKGRKILRKVGKKERRRGEENEN